MRPSRMSESGREALPDVLEWSGGPPEVREWLGGPTVCSVVVMRPYRMSWSGPEALQDFREVLPDIR